MSVTCVAPSQLWRGNREVSLLHSLQIPNNCTGNHHRHIASVPKQRELNNVIYIFFVSHAALYDARELLSLHTTLAPADVRDAFTGDELSHEPL